MRKLILLIAFTVIAVKFYAQTLPIYGASKIAVWSPNRDSAGFTTVGNIASQIALINGSGTVTSVSGTANRVTVATGTTTPVVDIAATYVGQTSITTLGTITTGVWNGTAIANANLANSTISGVALGSSLAALTTGTNLTSTLATYNGSAASTLSLSSTLTGLTSVTSTTFVGALTGNATTATSATNVTGITGAANGGTGASTLTGYIYGNGIGVMSSSTVIPAAAVGNGITNAQLVNNAITVNGVSTPLGGSATVTLQSATNQGASTTIASSFTGGLTSSGSATLSGASGAVTLSGSVTNTQAIKTTAYTIVLSDREIVADATAGVVAITLPACTAGREVIIIRKNMAGGFVTITRAGTDTINSNSQFTLASAGILVLKGLGTDWITNFSN